MRRFACLALLLAVACTGGKGDDGDAEALTKLVRSGDRVKYHAAYRYELGGPLSAAVETRMEIFQLPPDRLTRFEVSTQTITTPVVSWLVERGDESYGCSQQKQIVCVRRAPDDDVFGAHEVDEPLRLARTKGFETVKVAGTKTIVGKKADCYDGTSRVRRPVVSPRPRFQPTGWKYRLCYSADGILLSIRRSAVTSNAPEGAVFEFVATSVSSTVANKDVSLPGAVFPAEDLRPTVKPPSPSATPRRTGSTG